MSAPAQAVAVILAAGRSSRMGRPKPLVRLQGETFLARILALYQQSNIPCAVVLGANAAAVQRDVDLSRATVLLNPDPDRGQLSSLQLALQSIRAEAGILVHPVDHPLVREATISSLTAAGQAEPGRIIIPEYGTRKGHPVFFGCALHDQLLQAPLEQGARWVVHRNADRVMRLPVDDPGILWDIDTPEELDAVPPELLARARPA